MMRPTKSGVPPAANGTITRTGLLGYGCGNAPVASVHSAAARTRTAPQRPLRRIEASYAESARLDAGHELERVVPLDRLPIRRAEAPFGDALVDLGTVAEGKVGAVHHLRD